MYSCVEMFSRQREKEQPFFKLNCTDRNNDVMLEREPKTKQFVESQEEQEYLNGEKLTSLHAKLHLEADKIRKWKNQIEYDIKQKDQKIQESCKTVENLRKSVLDLQLDNESLSMKLLEESSNREEVLQNISSVKMMCEVLKEHLTKAQCKIADCEAEKTEVRYLQKEYQQQFETLSKQFSDVEIESEKEHKRLTELVDKKQKDYEDLHEDMKQKSISSKTQLNEMLEKLDAKDIEIRDIRKEVAKYEVKEHDLQSIIDGLQTDLASSEAKLEQLKEKYDKLAEELLDVQKQRESLENELFTKAEEIEKLMSEKEELNKEIQSLSEKLVQDTLILQRSLDDVSHQLNTKEKKLRFLEADLERATSEIQEVKCSKDVVLMEKADITAKVLDLEKQRTDLISQLDQANLSLNQTRQSMDEQKQLLQEREDESSSLMQQLNELKSQVESAQSYNVQLEERMQTLQQEISVKQDSILRLQTQIEEQNHQMEFLSQRQREAEQLNKDQRQKSETTMRELEETVSALSLSKESSKKVLDAEIQMLNEKLLAKNSVEADLREKIDDLESELKGEREKSKSIQNERQAHEKAVEGKLLSREKAATDMEGKIKNLKSDLSSKNKQIKDLEKELKGIKAKNSSLTRNLAEKADELELKKCDIDSFKIEYEKMKEECKEANQKVKEMEIVSDRCIKEKEEMFRKCEGQRSEMSAIMQNYKTDNDKLVAVKDKEIEALKSEMNSKVTNLQSEIDHLRISVGESGHQMEILQKGYAEKESVIKRLEMENSMKLEELKELQNQLESMYMKTTTTADVQTSPYPALKRQIPTQKMVPKTPQINPRLETIDRTPQPMKTPIVLNTPGSKTPSRSILKSLSSSSNKKRKVVFASKDVDNESIVSDGSDTFEIMETGDTLVHNTPLVLISPRTKTSLAEVERTSDLPKTPSVSYSRPIRGPPVDLEKLKRQKQKKDKENGYGFVEDQESMVADYSSKAKDKQYVRNAPQKSSGKFFKTSPKTLDNEEIAFSLRDGEIVLEWVKHSRQQYVPTGISNAQVLKLEYEKRELQQKRHYFLFSELQNMVRELPGKFQQRMSYDLLSGLANALLDGTVFQIVNTLKEVQEWEERSMFQQRSKLVSDHKAQKHELQKKHKEMLHQCQSKPHNLPLVKTQIDREMETTRKRCDEEIRKKDQKIIMELDQKVMDQQSTLEKAGVPGFFVTNKPMDIRLQMYLLSFITRLAQLEMPT